jgi:hypothetical protein
MAKRVSELLVPLMTDEELAEIILNGQALLNVDLLPIVADIVNYSVGMPSICHQLALNTCLEKGISVGARDRIRLTRSDLRPALDRYVNESSDTIKAVFGQALKHRATARFDNRRIILAAVAQGPLAGMSFPEILAKVRTAESEYPESNLRRYLKELSDEERGRLLRLGRSGKYRFVEPVYHTVALATLVGPRTPKHARPNRYVEEIVAAAWLNTTTPDAMWEAGQAASSVPSTESEERPPEGGAPVADRAVGDEWSADALELLKERFMMLHSMSNDRARGPLFVQFLDDLFGLFGAQSWLTFSSDQNLIDGSIDFDSADRAFQATWGQASVAGAQVEEFASRIRIKGGAPLGIFLSINGFPDDVLDATGNSPTFIGVDGADVFLILDQRVRLDELLRHKIRVVEETGSYFVSARSLIIE